MKEYFIIKVKDKKQYILNVYNEHTDDISCTFTTFLNKAKRWKEEDTVKYLVFKLVFILDKVELEYLKKKFIENKPEKIVKKIEIIEKKPEIVEVILPSKEEIKEELLLLDEIIEKKEDKKEVKKIKKKKPKKQIIKKAEIKSEPVVNVEQPEKKENVLSSLKGIISKKIKKIQEEIKYYY